MSLFDVAADSRPGGPLPVRPGQILRKYGNIFRVSLIERLTYRGDFFLSTLLRFLPMVTTILLWTAIYQGAAVQHQQDAYAVHLNGFSLRELIAYLLLVHISRMFSSMPGLATGIACDIRDGSLKKYLLQPIDMIAYLLSYRAAHKVAYIGATTLPYALLFFLCRDYLREVPWPDLVTLAAYLATLLLAFLVGFFFETCLGTLGFWFLEVTSFLYVVNTLNFFVSGQMFPLDLLPAPWPAVLKAMPFQFLAYFPAAVLLGKIQGAALVRGLLVETGWVVFFVILSRVLYRVGLRRYSAFGG